MILRWGYGILALITNVATQQLIPSNLPPCAQQCTALQQGQTGCVPAGGAPVTNSGIYQSCFCQSALLSQLYTPNPVQLCTSCSGSDMSTIQQWYKGFCGKGGTGANAAGPAPAAGAPATTSTNANPAAALPTLPQQPTATGNAAAQSPATPWINNHWKWLVMLLILILGLSGLAVGGTMLHRRYHMRRQAGWSTHPGSQPDITTWGPGQSVHDLRYGASSNIGGYANEKGKATESVRGMTQVSSAATSEFFYPQNSNTGSSAREKRISSGRFF